VKAGLSKRRKIPTVWQKLTRLLRISRYKYRIFIILSNPAFHRRVFVLKRGFSCILHE
jgi:hypothetical protein